MYNVCFYHTLFPMERVFYTLVGKITVYNVCRGYSTLPEENNLERNIELERRGPKKNRRRKKKY